MLKLKFGDPESIARAAASKKPIDQMYVSFGQSETDAICADCCHWLTFGMGCGVYERTHPRQPFPWDSPACSKVEIR